VLNRRGIVSRHWVARASVSERIIRWRMVDESTVVDRTVFLLLIGRDTLCIEAEDH
jgi:hypothetical protein